jgi:hypothetical protein
VYDDFGAATAARQSVQGVEAAVDAFVLGRVGQGLAGSQQQPQAERAREALQQGGGTRAR